MGLLKRLEKAGTERRIRKRIEKYAKESGVEIVNLEIIWFNDDYKVKITYLSDERSKYERFRELVDSDPYLKDKLY